MPKKFYHKLLRFSARHWTTIFEENGIFYDCDSQEEGLKEVGSIHQISGAINNYLKNGAEVIEVFK